jgi:hypothetical protein
MTVALRVYDVVAVSVVFCRVVDIEDSKKKSRREKIKSKVSIRVHKEGKARVLDAQTRPDQTVTRCGAIEIN